MNAPQSHIVSMITPLPLYRNAEQERSTNTIYKKVLPSPFTVSRNKIQGGVQRTEGLNIQTKILSYLFTSTTLRSVDTLGNESRNFLLLLYQSLLKMASTSLGYHPHAPFRLRCKTWERNSNCWYFLICTTFSVVLDEQRRVTHLLKQEVFRVFMREVYC